MGLNVYTLHICVICRYQFPKVTMALNRKDVSVFFKYSKWPVTVQTRYATTKKDIKYAIMYCVHAIETMIPNLTLPTISLPHNLNYSMYVHYSRYYLCFWPWNNDM